MALGEQYVCIPSINLCTLWFTMRTYGLSPRNITYSIKVYFVPLDAPQGIENC
jgi:hypothetical protein